VLEIFHGGKKGGGGGGAAAQPGFQGDDLVHKVGA